MERNVQRVLHVCQWDRKAPTEPTKGRWIVIILKWLLFETKLGELLLVCLERRVGLAVVQADWLSIQPSGEPRTMSKVQ